MKGKGEMKKLIRYTSIFVLISITSCKFAKIEQSNKVDPFAMYRELTIMDIVGIVAVLSIISFFVFLSLYLQCEQIIKYKEMTKGIPRGRQTLDKESRKMKRRTIVSLILAITCNIIFIHTRGIEGIKEIIIPDFLIKGKIEKQE